ncbi:MULTISPECIES: hypothetical protein [Streptomyces]|nr:hypothetical protein [Streptomyces sp. WAC00263]
MSESFRSENVAPAGIGDPVTKVCDSSQKTLGSPSAGFWLSLVL